MRWSTARLLEIAVIGGWASAVFGSPAGSLGAKITIAAFARVRYQAIVSHHGLRGPDTGNGDLYIHRYALGVVGRH